MRVGEILEKSRCNYYILMFWVFKSKSRLQFILKAIVAMHRLSHTLRSLGVGLCRLQESELQGSRFFFGELPRVTPFLKSVHSQIHATYHLIYKIQLIFCAILLKLSLDSVLVKESTPGVVTPSKRV